MLNFAFHLEWIGTDWNGLDWLGKGDFDTYRDTCLLSFDT